MEKQGYTDLVEKNQTDQADTVMEKGQKQIYILCLIRYDRISKYKKYETNIKGGDYLDCLNGG